MDALYSKGHPERPLLLAITILTSSTEEPLSQVGISRPVREMVPHLARLAREAGLDGVVASPQEVALIREVCGPEFGVLTPGVRPTFAAMDDQKRVMTPAEAIAAGAHYLVVGRPIATAEDPEQAAAMILEEIDQALQVAG